jgi:hypothetical protein
VAGRLAERDAESVHADDHRDRGNLSVEARERHGRPGPTVAYNWWCDTGKDCFPDNVTHNGYRVKLYYDATRPGVITYATGTSMAEIRQRLKSIKVELTSGSAIRAYRLLYSTSSSSGRSLLSSVQVFGSDVEIDGSGNINHLEGTRLNLFTSTHDTRIPKLAGSFLPTRCGEEDSC